MIGVNGDLKGDLTSHQVEVWGKLDGNIKVTGTLTVQEEGIVSGKLEYENLQVKLGGQITGDIHVAKKSNGKKTSKTALDNMGTDGYNIKNYIKSSITIVNGSNFDSIYFINNEICYLKMYWLYKPI